MSAERVYIAGDAKHGQLQHSADKKALDIVRAVDAPKASAQAVLQHERNPFRHPTWLHVLQALPICAARWTGPETRDVRFERSVHRDTQTASLMSVSETHNAMRGSFQCSAYPWCTAAQTRV